MIAGWQGEVDHTVRGDVRGDHSLDDLNLSTFNVGGSQEEAPLPFKSVNGKEDEQAEADIHLGKARAELWVLQEQSAKWTTHLQTLEGAISYRTNMLDGEEAKLEKLKQENDELMNTLHQMKNDYAVSSTELSTLRKARIQQVEDNDFTRQAIVEESRQMQEERRQLLQDVETLRVSKEALKKFLEDGAKHRSDDNGASDEESGGEEVVPDEELSEEEYSSPMGGSSSLTGAKQPGMAGLMHATSTPYGRGVAGRGLARGRGMASVVDPRVGGLATPQLTTGDQAAQKQLADLVAEHQARALRERKELGERQMKIWEAQKAALIQQQRDVDANAKLAKELAEEEAIQLKRRTAETKAASAAASTKDAAMQHEQEEAEKERRAEASRAKDRFRLSLQAQCQYMSDGEKKWWYDNGFDPTNELVTYGKYQEYLQRIADGNPTPAQKPKPKGVPRRSRMSAGMERLYSTNPAVAGLGLDNVGASADECDSIHRCLKIASGIRGSTNAARRLASEPAPYWQRNSWEEYLSVMVDEINFSGWDFEESIPYLCKGLRIGDGYVAVEQWKAECGPGGTWAQLVETATVLFMGKGHDPMANFKKRVQSKTEPPRGYGLALMRLLKKVYPDWGLDNEIFAKELFTQFIGGLRDPEVQRVAYDTWNTDTSLNDLFRAIENNAMKKSLLGGKIVNTVSSLYTEPDLGSTSENEEQGADSAAAAAQFKKNGKVPNAGWKPKKPEPVPEQDGKTMEKEKKPEKMDAAFFAALIEKMATSFQQGKPGGRRRVNKKTAKCYRCLAIGHFAHECLAPSPKVEDQGN